jgi:hypothetical protein
VTKTVRNVAIIAALAGLLFAIPGAGTAANVFVWLAGVGFLAAMAWFATITYRENRYTLEGLGDRMRGVLYGSVALAVVTVTATPRLWNTPGGTLLWFVLVGMSVYGVYTVWRSWRTY